MMMISTLIVERCEHTRTVTQVLFCTRLDHDFLPPSVESGCGGVVVAWWILSAAVEGIRSAKNLNFYS